MPGGEGWQFLGRSIGANPVPVAYAETYTGLQTGVIDGQDNPLVNTRLMKFHEVTNQIALDRAQRRLRPADRAGADVRCAARRHSSSA